MAIENIDLERCSGCGACVKVCPMDVFRLDRDRKKAIVRYAEDCMLCAWCLMECPNDVITVTWGKESPLLVSWG